jgi:uncharacterized protein YfeS
VSQKVPKTSVNLNNKKGYRVVRISKNDSKHDKVAKAELNDVLVDEGILSTGEYLSCNVRAGLAHFVGNITQTLKNISFLSILLYIP